MYPCPCRTKDLAVTRQPQNALVPMLLKGQWGRACFNACCCWVIIGASPTDRISTWFILLFNHFNVYRLYFMKVKILTQWRIKFPRQENAPAFVLNQKRWQVITKEINYNELSIHYRSASLKVENHCTVFQENSNVNWFYIIWSFNELQRHCQYHEINFSLSTALDQFA